MSRAFVKETDGEDVFDQLPDRPISPHPNLVSRRGLALIEAEIARLRAALAEAQTNNERAAMAATSRDLRYWTARRASADVVPPAEDASQVRFGLRVTIERDDGHTQSFRIVGQDEADPAKGLLSYVSPLARALLGKRVGDTVPVGSGDAEIVAIDTVPDGPADRVSG
jgi:transcription elongation GreA/GreB family factor